MAIRLKTEADLMKMRDAGMILADIHENLKELVAPGVTTAEIDQAATALCKKYQVIPAFKNYQGYPATICVGVDDVAIHGIPSEKEYLSAGQIISIDMGVILDGFYSDQAYTYGVGEIDEEAQRLLSTTALALNAAIMQTKPGNHIGDISFAMQQVTELAGFNVIRDMVGHGIGRELHEDPQIPCYGKAGSGELIKEGMVFAIEAMVNEGSSELAWGEDNWTTYTADGMRSAIFEHTVAVNATGAEILTIK